MPQLPSPLDPDNPVRDTLRDLPQPVVYAVGAVAGAALGWLAVWASAALVGGLVTGVLGAGVLLRWANGERITLAMHTLEIPGLPNVTLAVDRSHREAAWRVLVQLTSRIATQPLADDGAALASLYGTFKALREELLKLEPGHAVNGLTVEAVVLALLNRELRPVLARWHPSHDQWQASEAQAPWPDREPFRQDLRKMQAGIGPYVRQLAGVLGLDAEHILPPTAEQVSS